MTPIAPLITSFLREHMPIEQGCSASGSMARRANLSRAGFRRFLLGFMARTIQHWESGARGKMGRAC